MLKEIFIITTHNSDTNTWGKRKPKLCENSWKSPRNIDTVINLFGFYDIFVHPPWCTDCIYSCVHSSLSYRFSIFNKLENSKHDTEATQEQIWRGVPPVTRLLGAKRGAHRTKLYWYCDHRTIFSLGFISLRLKNRRLYWCAARGISIVNP